MFSIDEYKLLKINGTSKDCYTYILSISDKDSIEKYLKESLSSCYSDIQMFIFLSRLNKNEKNLIELFNNDSLPVKQRALTIQHWIKLQKNEKKVHNFIVETINNEKIPRYLKHKILKNLNKIDYLKNSSEFFYNLLCDLTKSNNHNQYNIDVSLIKRCRKEHIIDLLLRWSIKRFEQIDCSSSFYFKLIRYHPIILIHLIKQDLCEIEKDSEKFSNYFSNNEKLFHLLSKKVPKDLICLTMEYLNQIEKHKRFLPEFIQKEQKYFFKTIPLEMIELITIVASNSAGQIKYVTQWTKEGYEMSSFLFPRSFSVENYFRLFVSLYDKCQWSSNNTIKIFQYLLENSFSNIYSLKKERIWLIEKIIETYIGKELFFSKLFKEGNESYLNLFSNYPELTTSYSIHLISEYQKDEIIQDTKHLSLIRYQLMTKDLFDQFLTLFKKTSADINQRKENYFLFLQCACSSNDHLFIKKVLEFIEKRFTNEQILVIEYFLNKLSSLNNRFHLEYLPHNYHSIESIINIAINHLQQSKYTLTNILFYGIFLLKSIEKHPNTQRKQIIQQFSINIIKRCYTKNDSLTMNSILIDESYKETIKIYSNILISDLYPKLISKSMLTELNDSLYSFVKNWNYLREIDSFINLFFTEYICSSTALQSTFDINKHSSIVSCFIKNKSTQNQRINYLINNLDKIFFIDENVQRVALHCQQCRKFIDELIEDDKCLTIDKLFDEKSKFKSILNSDIKNIKFPGLNVQLLNSCCHLLTGKQQEHITKIILNDYLQDNDISNLDKLKSLCVLRRLSSSYNSTLEWIYKNQDSQSIISNNNKRVSGHARGASVQPLDAIFLCLPATFDLTPDHFIKQFHLLKNNLNSSNAKFISDAFLNISRKINDDIFLRSYLEFISDEKFNELGITTNKEMLRLLIEYVSNTSLVQTVVKPLWDNHPHQDVRACLILTLLHFIVKINSHDDNNDIIWNILEQAAYDDYLPVVKSFFAADRGKSRWPLSKLKNSSQDLFEIFVNRIQFKILDHPTSLEARSWAWSNIEYEYCNMNSFIEKAKLLCIQFDKNANNLWKNAFEKILLSFREHKISSTDVIIDILKNLFLLRDDIDAKQNANDKNHDLPVYHRIQNILNTIIIYLNEFNNEDKLCFRSIIPIILQFDKTLVPFIGKVVINTAQTREDIEDGLKILEENVSESYFERILIDLSKYIDETNSSSFIRQLNVNEKFDLAQWFIEQKNRPLLVFDLLRNHVFNQANVDLEQCQRILRHLRQSKNLFLQERTMTYIVPWKEDGTVKDNNNDDYMDEFD